MAEVELTLNSPITEEQWDAITDVDFDHTNRVWFHTKHGKQVEFIKAKPVTSNADRIRAMSDEKLANWLCAHSSCHNCEGVGNCMDGLNGWLSWLRSPAEGGDGDGV